MVVCQRDASPQTADNLAITCEAIKEANSASTRRNSTTNREPSNLPRRSSMRTLRRNTRPTSPSNSSASSQRPLSLSSRSRSNAITPTATGSSTLYDSAIDCSAWRRNASREGRPVIGSFCVADRDVHASASDVQNWLISRSATRRQSRPCSGHISRCRTVTTPTGRASRLTAKHHATASSPAAPSVVLFAPSRAACNTYARPVVSTSPMMPRCATRR